MIRTLHLTNAWHPSSGGISTFYRALMQAAERRRQRMSLVVPGERSWREDIGEFGRIYHVATGRAPINGAYRMLYPARYLLPGAPIVKILRAEAPDLVEISDKYTMPYLGGLLRLGSLPGYRARPAVIGLSCERMDENLAAYLHRGKWGPRFTRVYMKWLYFPLFDHHITVSEHTALELEVAARGHKVRRGVWVKPMGVDTSQFSHTKRCREKRRELAVRAGGGDDSVLLLYAGRLAREKNAALLIGVMEHLAEAGRDFRLLIAGSGELREDLEACARQRVPGRVCFLGHIDSREALATLYANCDIFLHPNPREPFGIAPLEAMASGIPLVAPNSGGVTAYANATNAWLGEASGAVLASLVLKVQSDPAELARKTAAASWTAWSHRWETVADGFLSLYDELHAVTLGAKPEAAVAPRFYSTPGDLLGRELGDRGRDGQRRYEASY